jgi:hypothetical protein
LPFRKYSPASGGRHPLLLAARLRNRIRRRLADKTKPEVRKKVAAKGRRVDRPVPNAPIATSATIKFLPKRTVQNSICFQISECSNEPRQEKMPHFLHELIVRERVRKFYQILQLKNVNQNWRKVTSTNAAYHAITGSRPEQDSPKVIWLELQTGKREFKLLQRR